MHSEPPPHVQLRAVHPSDVMLSQLRPHAPQLFSSFVTFVHEPLQHSSLPAQVRPHAPQFATVVVDTQLPLQHERPEPHGPPLPHRHVPPEHVSPAAHDGVHVVEPQVPPLQLIPVPQRMPHMPQWFGFVLVSTQPPEQHVCVAAHAAPAPQRHAPSSPHVSPASHAGVHAAAMHVPAMQVSPVEQRRPHAPQCVVLVCVSTQPPEQHADAPVHAAVVPQRHMPIAHASAAAPQSRPHIPHSVRDMLRSMHAPSQQVRPAPHVPP